LLLSGLPQQLDGGNSEIVAADRRERNQTVSRGFTVRGGSATVDYLLAGVKRRMLIALPISIVIFLSLPTTVFQTPLSAESTGNRLMSQ